MNHENSADMVVSIDLIGGGSVAFWTTPDPSPQPADAPRPNKYQRVVKGAILDVYDVLDAFDVRCPAIQHALKKALMPGTRGSKGKLQDITEARDSLNRAIELERERNA